MPWPAISNAVPWSTDVRMIGSPSVILTPDSASHRPVGGIDLEAQQLDRDVALIVIVGDDRVILTGPKLHKDRVAGHRADHVQTVRDRPGDHRSGDVDVVPPEQPALAGMGVQRRDGDAGAVEPQPASAHHASGRSPGAGARAWPVSAHPPARYAL